MPESLKRQALDYHSAEPHGKLQVLPTKPMATQHDLSLAYSPGVAHACEAISADPATAWDYTGRGNLVAVITNGTAVLGLGNIGALAAKPVMEGKGALFKKFSGIDVYDLEVAETGIDAFCEVVARLEPSFGGINLEDIRAPECFEIEKRLRARMNIPVFHDDQHGTAIVTAAAVLNGLDLVGKALADVRIVCNGAGAAAIACLDLLLSFGARRENVMLCDSKGLVHADRSDDVGPYKAAYGQATDRRTLMEALEGADILLGLSVGRAVTPQMVAAMAPKPLILAMANPEPEIRPEQVRTVRDDAIIATGRSDYPNQVNNVLCFPFIFRGALDVGATEINEAMKRACAEAIAAIARAEASDIVLAAYGAENMRYGPDYIIPKPFDPRLILEVAPAVAQAAMDSGVAARPITDMDDYRERLSRFVFRSGMLMKPVFEKAASDPRRVAFSEGTADVVLHAAQEALTAGIAKPVLIGSRSRIAARINELGLHLTIGANVQVVDPDEIAADTYASDLARCAERSGGTLHEAAHDVRGDSTVLAALMLARGEVDAVICGTGGRFAAHLAQVERIIGRAEGVRGLSTLDAVILPSGTIFIADTYVTPDPNAHEIAELTLLAARTLRRMGIEPKVALMSHSNFGDRPSASSDKMRRAAEILSARNPDFEVDGEMHADVALSERLRARRKADSTLTGTANLLVMPNMDAAHISLNLLKTMGGGVSVGPIMLGAARPMHIVSQSTTVRGLLNMTAIATVDAQGEM